jgi:signal peptidase I
MLPTLKSGDYILVKNRIDIIESGSIIVYHNGITKNFNVKRVWGCSGDTIILEKSQLYIIGNIAHLEKLLRSFLENKEPIMEIEMKRVEYINKEIISIVFAIPITDFTPYPDTIIIAPQTFYVIGDNYIHSNDSRSIGTIKKSHIKGLMVRKINILGNN